ncbi:hypothetical protein C1645_832995 [Glomus cerebriforme]|uniref:Uncharacterized protein n=1 Tax=Glomus cerebriforme TaxID=658196 RepID=A0A397SIF9_9GLOM|nr:hypothetical protein C1645_832995 [Glomus cerebriforme]
MVDEGVEFQGPIGFDELKLSYDVLVRYLLNPDKLEDERKCVIDYDNGNGPKRSFVRKKLQIIPPDTELPFQWLTNMRYNLYNFQNSGEYSCNYLLKTEGICGQTCYRPEGCFEYWKARKHLPYKICDKPTSSEPSLCKKYANSYYMNQYINRL